MRYPVVNLQPRLGQIKEFETLTDQQLSRIQNAVDSYNNWKDWDDTPTGDRYMRDAVSDVQSALDSVPESIRLAAMQEIQKYVDNSEDLVGHLQMPGPHTPPAQPGAAPVASIDRARTEPPPPPNTNPPVASGQPGPGAGAFSNKPVASGSPGPGYKPPPAEPTGFTGSEPEPEPPPPQPPPPPIMGPPGAPIPPPQPPPPVASGGNGCYYTFGQGYSWGARPPSGEPTGLNEAACQNLIALDREIRGLPVQNTTAPPANNLQAQNTQANTATMVPQTPPPPAPPEHAPVASGGPTSCGEGQFWDGRQCRGSVAPGFGNLMNTAMNAGGAATGGAISPGNLDINPGSISNASFAGMGSRKRRYPVVNL